MPRRLLKLFKRSLQTGVKTPKVATLKDLHAIRSALLSGVTDCEGVQAQRLHLKIGAARSAQDLWMLRNDAYQVISQQHSQTIAADRINQLMGSFEGWIEPRQLMKIR